MFLEAEQLAARLGDSGELNGLACEAIIHDTGFDGRDDPIRHALELQGMICTRNTRGCMRSVAEFGDSES